MLNVFNLLLGGSLLIAGRKLFWLFVGVLGFIVGMQFVQRFWTGGPQIVAVIVGVVVGIIFALLAIFPGNSCIRRRRLPGRRICSHYLCQHAWFGSRWRFTILGRLFDRGNYRRSFDHAAPGLGTDYFILPGRCIIDCSIFVFRSCNWRSGIFCPLHHRHPNSRFCSPPRGASSAKTLEESSTS